VTATGKNRIGVVVDRVAHTSPQHYKRYGRSEQHFDCRSQTPDHSSIDPSDVSDQSNSRIRWASGPCDPRLVNRSFVASTDVPAPRLAPLSMT
jgi:hypothetical protein